MQLPTHLIPKQVIEVCKILNNAGYQAFIVGGCVRDLILGEIPKDYDITTDATPQKIMKLFPKNYPTGLQHGTVTISMGDGIENHFEITTFRIEGEYKDGRRPEEVFFVMNVNEDLARRDLTINAIAYDPILQSLVDPFNGISDIKSNIIRSVNNADARFKEDGLRIMRVARFAAKLQFSIENNTFQSIKNNLDTLKKVSKERIKDELCKTLMTKNPSFGLRILNESGVLNIIAPLLTSNSSYINTISYLNNCKGDLETKIAYLYNKYETSLVLDELIALKFSNKEIKRVKFLLDLLERYNHLDKKQTILTYKSFMALIKNHSPDTWEYTLEQFINLSEALGLKFKHIVNTYKNVKVYSRNELLINGNDLLSFGLSAGPNIKSILDACYLEILRHPEHNNQSFLMNFAKKLAK